MQQQQKKLRYVPIYDDIGKIIGYNEVFFARNEQEISLLNIELKKNKLEYDQRLKEKLKQEKARNDEIEKFKKEEKEALERRIEKIEESITNLNKDFIKYKDSLSDIFKTMNKKVDSLQRAVDSLLKQQLSISIANSKMPYGKEED